MVGRTTDHAECRGGKIIMPTLNFTITALAPLVFSERKPDGQFRPSTPYVPGAVVRGALAQQFIDAGSEQSDEFRILFTDTDAPLFRNAYPALFERNESSDVFTPSRLLPATAYSCKAEGGFEKHGVYDSLIDRLCCETLGIHVPYLPRCNHQEHAGVGGRVESFSGFHADTKKVKRS